jgi:serine/threonine-protein kinase
MGSTTDDKFVGKTLPGGYHILDLISVGGMGRVYRAEQSALGRTVAVKIIHPHLLSDDNSALRFITEARAASQLNHPNSIAVFDFGRTDDGQPYLVMEFLRGKDLARVAYEEGPLGFSRIVDVLRQTLAALSEAHDLGIVHRDLKPENIILEPLRRGGDFVKVVDFGLAKLRADAHTPSVTSPGIVCGTPDYMAPEQGRGDPIDGRSDLYAMGVILFQLLTGRLPFEADSPTQVVMMHMTIPVPDPRQVAAERHIPEPLAQVVFKALAKDAKKRYQDAIEFADALKSALALAESVPPDQRFSLAPSSLVAATAACPSCGHQVPVAKFCLECGTRLPPRLAMPENHTQPSLPLPLVARDDDVSWLEDRRQQLRGAVIGARLVGEQGAGKTRLMSELLARASIDSDLIAETGPDPHHAEVAGYALRTAIEALAGLSELEMTELVFEDASPDAEAGLAELFDPTPKRHDIRSPRERRLALAEALRWALSRAARRSKSGRTVLAIDDLQRVDGPSRNAFADVLAEPPRVPALVLAAHTPGFDAGWGAEAASRILPGLPPPAVSRLLRSSRSGARDDTGRGVLPMYVEQVLRYTQEGGSDPPARLADLIALRVDTLEPAARRTLQALAVMGDKVKPDTVSEILRGENVEGTLPELRKAGMVSVHGAHISTSHPLLRDIVLLGIPAAVKKDLHSRALRACERLSAPIEARAQHAYYAGDSFQALLLLEQVAERAAARGDTATEVLALRRGLEIARQEIARGELDDPLRAVLIFGRKLGASLTRAGNFADAEGVLREALDVAGPSGTDRARVLSALAHVSHGRRRSSEAMGYIDQAIAVARESGANDLVSAFADTRRAWAS